MADFNVFADRPLSLKKGYRTADAAEAAARRIVKMRGGEMTIWRWSDAPKRGRHTRAEEIAVVLTDALDRFWTQVIAGPG